MPETSELIAAIKADREAGTPGPWMLDISQSKYLSRENKHCHLISGPGWAYFARIWVRLMDTDENTPVGEANARRIARVPDMEAAIIAQATEIERLQKRGWRIWMRNFANPNARRCLTSVNSVMHRGGQ